MILSVLKLFAAIICGKIRKESAAEIITALANGQLTAQIAELRRQTEEIAALYH